jgi:hypothetical protein
MTKTLFAAYKEVDAVKNSLDDLINHGIDREKIFADEDSMEVRVMIHEAMEAEVNEILNRHHPA